MNPQKKYTGRYVSEFSDGAWVYTFVPDARDALLNRLDELIVLSQSDAAVAHVEADDLILKYLDDLEITKRFYQMVRWYE